MIDNAANNNPLIPKDLPSASGVYRLKLGDTFYIGSSANIRHRAIEHVSMLRKGKHENNLVQAAFDDIPDTSLLTELDFIVVELLPIEEARLLETDLILDSYVKDLERETLNLKPLLLNLMIDNRPLAKKSEEEKELIHAKIKASWGNRSDEEREKYSKKLSSQRLGEFKGDQARREVIRQRTKLMMELMSEVELKVITDERRETLYRNRKNLSPEEICRRKGGQPIMIDETIYYGVREAGRILNICNMTISGRLRNDNYPNYYKCDYAGRKILGRKFFVGDIEFSTAKEAYNYLNVSAAAFNRYLDDDLNYPECRKVWVYPDEV